MKFATIAVLRLPDTPRRCSPFHDNKFQAIHAARHERRRVMTNEPAAVRVAVGAYNDAGDLVAVYSLKG